MTHDSRTVDSVILSSAHRLLFSHLLRERNYNTNDRNYKGLLLPDIIRLLRQIFEFTQIEQQIKYQFVFIVYIFSKDSNAMLENENSSQ